MDILWLEEMYGNVSYLLLFTGSSTWFIFFQMLKWQVLIVQASNVGITMISSTKAILKGLLVVVWCLVSSAKSQVDSTKMVGMGHRGSRQTSFQPDHLCTGRFKEPCSTGSYRLYSGVLYFVEHHRNCGISGCADTHRWLYDRLLTLSVRKPWLPMTIKDVVVGSTLICVSDRLHAGDFIDIRLSTWFSKLETTQLLFDRWMNWSTPDVFDWIRADELHVSSALDSWPSCLSNSCLLIMSYRGFHQLGYHKMDGL